MIDGNVELSLKNFYDIVHNVIDANVPNLNTTPSHYPSWYSLELKQLISEKKQLHAIYKESKRLRLPRQVQDYLQFSKTRALCIRLSRELYSK